MAGLRAAAVSLLALISLVITSEAAIAQLASDPATRYVVAPQDNEVRYRVREQLAGIDFPNDAVGATRLIEGGIAFSADGTIVTDESEFTINLASLTSDRDRRDSFLRRRTLETDKFPRAVFVPKQLNGLRFPLPESGDVTFQLVGDLTVRGQTLPVTWQVTANIANGAIAGEAKTQLTFADLGIEKPRVRSVLSVNDDIRLEYTFFLVAR